MAEVSGSHQAVSAAVFCPQNKPPKTEYLAQIRRYLHRNPVLEPFKQAIIDIPSIWQFFMNANKDIAALNQQPSSLHPEELRRWLLSDNEASHLPIPDIMSGILALPLLTIIQIVQYFQYLEFRDITHEQFLHEIRIGGTQGFCGGLLPAIAIATSKTAEEVVQTAGKSVRLALGIGAYGELGDDPDVPGATTLVLRAKYPGQADEVVSKFPGTYVSAVTDPVSVSIVGPVRVLQELKAHCEVLGLAVTQVNLRGKVHNPENRELSDELYRLCNENPELLQLPGADHLQVPVRSNGTGELISDTQSLTYEVVASTLLLRCDWYGLLTAVSQDLKTRAPDERTHVFAMFGTGRKNCIPPAPFEQNGLTVRKLDVMTTVVPVAPTAGPPVDPRPSQTFPDEAIAIVGAACRLPGADSLDELWDLIREGKSMVRELPAERVQGNHASRLRFGRDGTFTGMDDNSADQRHWYGNFIDDISSFDHALFGISPREAQYMDPQQRLLLETAYQALDSSGYLRHHRREDYDNVGCFVGTTYTEYLENTTAYDVASYSATGTIRAFQTGRISYHFGWSGPSETIDTACSSSIVAVHRACRAIQAGECPVALAGGVNIITGIQNFLDLGKAGFLNKTGQCKPFDHLADGYCRADGVGMVFLKSLRQAVSDGDDIMGVIPAVATNQGGLSSSITVPSARAQRDLLKTILRRGGMEARHVSYVEAHGTGTQVGDPIEISSIREVLGGSQRSGEPLYLGSVKANVGHSESAAGIGSLLKVLAMLQNSELPPLAGFQKLNPKISALEPDELYINRQPLPWNPSPSMGTRAAVINSYGASGSNSALICCEGPSGSHSPMGIVSEKDGHLSYPIFLSAATLESLRRSAAKLAAFIRKSPLNGKELKLGDIAFTLHERRKHYPLRWTYTATSLDELAQSLERDAEQDDEAKVAANSRSTVGTTTNSKPVILVFSGQSKKTVQLSNSWFQWFPRLRFHITECDRILQGLGYATILPAIFQSDPIEDVITLQCGTFAVQYACAMCWIDAGLNVQAVVGHSFGELTAMVISGAVSLYDGLKLVAGRASLMNTKWGAERGTMLAIHAARDVVEEVIATVKAQADGDDSDPTRTALEIACFNSAKSQVVVGSAAAVEKAQEVVKNDTRFQGTQQQLVNVSHGFHSPFTEPLLPELSSLAETLTFNRPTIPLELCTDSDSRKSGLEEVTPDRIVHHTRMPVYFSDAITRLEQRLGPSCVWLEAGADSPIVAMTKKALQNPSNHIFLPLRSDKDKNAITTATTTLWSHDVSASFWAFTSPAESGIKPIWLPPYQFQQKQHWLQWRDLGREIFKAVDSVPIAKAEPQIPQRLVTPLGTIPSTWASLEFSVNTRTSRFKEIVSGHAVRGFPVCPASMYMECVVMAAHTIKPEISPRALRFENLTFKSALGINQNRPVSLIMDGAGEYLTWAFSVSSSTSVSSSHKAVSNGSGASGSSRPTMHANGRFSVVSQAPDLHLHERIMAEHIQSLLSDPRAERLNARRAYALFSRVVNYANVLQGITSITMTGKHAVAQVTRPATPVSVSESTAADMCDTVILDTFIQVVGLLINSSEACPDGEVFIATGIDSIVIQDCNFSKHNEWSVYAMMSPSSSSKEQAHGDLLVFTADGKLVLTGSGIYFTRFRIDKFERVLRSISDSSTGSLASETTQAHNQPRHSSRQTHQAVAIPAATDLEIDESGEKTMVASEALSAATAMKEIGRLGLDSLTATQLRARIGGKLLSKEQELAFLSQNGVHDILLSSQDTAPDDVDTQASSNPHISMTPPPSDDHDSIHDGNGVSGAKTSSQIKPLTGTSPSSKTIKTRKLLLELISDNCGQPLALSSIEDSENLQDLGVDSLSVVELASSVEDAFGIKYTHDGLDLQSTITEMLEYLLLNARKG